MNFLSSIPGLKVTAICDINEDVLKRSREVHPDVATYSSLKEFCADDTIDLGICAVPDHAHKEVVLELVEAGKHAITEKPFGLNVAECTEMIESARRANVMLSVYQQRRWDGDYLTIKNIVNQGMIGDVFHIEAYSGKYGSGGYRGWSGDKSKSGNVLLGVGAHHVDQILNMMPGKVEHVYGFFQKRCWWDNTIEDQGNCVIKFEGGRIAEYEYTYLGSISKPRWRILGDRGGITVASGPVQKYFAEKGSHLGKDISYRNGYAEEIKVPMVDKSEASYYVNIADHLLTGVPLAVTPESARRNIAVMEAAETAWKTGVPQGIPFEYD
jgi:predicted dehydrogenase